MIKRLVIAIVLVCASVSPAFAPPFLGGVTEAFAIGDGSWDVLIFGNVVPGEQPQAYSNKGLMTIPGVGYGAGVGAETWLTDSFGLRALLQVDVWEKPGDDGPSFGASDVIVPLTIGVLFKLHQFSPNVYLYAPIDIGGSTNISSGPAPQPWARTTPEYTIGAYADAGLGMRFGLGFVEAKAAYMLMPSVYTTEMVVMPITLGVDF